MPVILAEQDYSAWLNPAEKDAMRLQPLLRQFPPDELMLTPVDPLKPDALVGAGA